MNDKRFRILTASVVGAAAFAGVAQAALVGEWTFDGQNMTNSGSAGSVHDGAFNNVAVEYSTDTVSGSGHSLVITSIDNSQSTTGGGFLSISNSATTDAGYVDTFDSATNFTYSMWVKSTDGSWYRWDTYGSKGDVSTVGWQMRMRDPDYGDSRNGTRVEFNGTGGGLVIDDATVDAPVNIEDQEWHLMTFTYDGTASNLNLYIDGDLQGTTTNIAYNNAQDYPLIFGAYADGSQGENILIDSIQFYDHALTAGEVEALASVSQFSVSALETSLELASPATLVTGSVEVAFSADTNVTVSVSVTEQQHADAFGVLAATPFVLDAPSSNAVIKIEFDNSTAGLTAHGDSSTGLVTVAWVYDGESVTNEVQVPISVTYSVPADNISISVAELGEAPEEVNPLNLTDLGTEDWVMLGMGGNTANRDEKADADNIGAVTVTGTHDAWSSCAYDLSWTNGSPTLVTNNVAGSWEAKPGSGDEGLSFSVDGLGVGIYTLTIYATKYTANGELNVSMDGSGSVSAAFDTDGSSADARYAVFTVDVDVEAEGDVLNVSYDVTEGSSQYANVGISAITLARNTVGTVSDISSFEIVSGGAEMALGFDSELGGTYGIMATDNLTAGTWSNIVTDIIGTGGEIIVTNGITKDVEFFRVYLQD